MNANELRIGNWVQIDDLPPEQITTESFCMLEKYGHWNLVKGIPLTPDWIERFGWNKTEYDYWIGINDNTYITCSEKGTYIGEDNDTYIPLNHIQYVHQLQNLYFALTGTELTLKP